VEIVEVTSPVEAELKKEWKAHPKQEKFISLPFSFKEAFYGGHKGPGKTEILVLLPILYGFHNNPNYRGIYMRRTYSDIEREIVERQRKYYPSTGAMFNEQKRRWRWPSGAVDRLGHAEHEQDIRDYDTDEYHLIRWDELTHFLEFQYQYLTFTRMRTTDPFLPAICRAAGNPGNIGHNFVRKRFIDPCPAGFKRIIDKKTGLSRIFIPAEIQDNPSILEHDPNYILLLQSLPEAERRAAFGDWYTFSGQVFEEWRIAPFQGEPETACHVIKPFEIPKWWPRIATIDWGFRAYTHILWSAISPDGRVYIYREYAEKKKKVEEWGPEFAAALTVNDETLEAVAIDPSARQERGTGTILEQFKIATGYNSDDGNPRMGSLLMADNDRISGKQLIHEYLRWTQKPHRIIPAEGFSPTRAMELYRKYGPRAYEDYVMTFQPQSPETNLPKMQIFDKAAPLLVDTLPTCIYKEKKDGQKPEDIAEFDGDDPIDNLRYTLKLADHLIRDANLKSKSANEIRPDEDMTSFYRRMEAKEKKEAEDDTDVPISRFHRARRVA
jgi:hypothetical protein